MNFHTATALLLFLPLTLAQTYHLSPSPATTSPTIQTTLPSPSLLDSPKVLQVTNTTFDWWYFDAVPSSASATDKSSLSLVFYNANNGGLAFLNPRPVDLIVQLGGSWPNGSALVEGFTFSENVEHATVTVEGEESSGTWGKYGGWTYDGRGGWEVYMTDEAQGINGSLKLQAIAPPTLPCSLPHPGASEILLPGVGWSSAVPDALATVDFTINGEPLSFSGIGYHDKNWGSQPFFDSVSSWYWGHAHLGPYSLVWFDALAQPTSSSSKSEEYVSAYVAKDGKVLTSSCASGIVKARPWGGEDKYPPPHNKKIPAGFEVVFDDVEGKKLCVNLTILDDVLPALNVYDRFIGTAEGQFHGEEEILTGVASFEQFRF